MLKLKLMKAKRVTLLKLETWSQMQWEKVMIEPKKDGFRFIRLRSQWQSSGRKLFSNTEDIRKPLQNLKIPSDWIIDGELDGRDWSHTMTLFRSTRKDVSSELNEGRFTIFDLVNPNKMDEPLIDRRERLIELFDKFKHPKIRVIQSDTVSSLEEFMELNRFHLASGCDGSMIKYATGPYEIKRSNYWLKYKPVKELDCKIVGFNIGDGKYSDTLGSIEVRIPVTAKEGNWSKHSTAVSGMSDKDRDYIWKHRKQLMNAIVEVWFRKVSEKNRLIEPRLDRKWLHRIRFDKEKT